MAALSIPRLGELEPSEYGSLISRPLPVRAFGGAFSFEFDRYEFDLKHDDFSKVVHNLLASSADLISAATPYVVQYYEDMVQLIGDDRRDLEILDPTDVWRFVEFGSVISMSRDYDNVDDVFASLECECRWEREHGLLLV